MEAVIAIYEEVIAKRDSLTAVQLHLYCKMIREAPGDRAMVIYWARRDGWWMQDDITTCIEILKAPNNSECIKYWSKRVPWWNAAINQTNELLSLGNQSMKNVEELFNEVRLNRERLSLKAIKRICNQMRQAPGDRAWYIFRAKQDGWWDQNTKATCAEIRKAPGNRAWTIACMISNGLWDQDNAAACECIVKSPGNIDESMALGRNLGWWVPPKECLLFTVDDIDNWPAGKILTSIRCRGITNFTEDEFKQLCVKIQQAPDNEQVISTAKREGWWVEPEVDHQVQQVQPDEPFKFEVGKYYQHTTGTMLHILGFVQSTMWGLTMVGEECGPGIPQLVPCGWDSTDYTQNYKEITKEEWMTNFS